MFERLSNDWKLGIQCLSPGIILIKCWMLYIRKRTMRLVTQNSGNRLLEKMMAC